MTMYFNAVIIPLKCLNHVERKLYIYTLNIRFGVEESNVKPWDKVSVLFVNDITFLILISQNLTL